MYKVFSIKYKNLRFLPIFILLSLNTLFLLLYAAPQAQAQEAVRNLTVVPPTIEKKMAPGGYVEGTMKVINDSTSPLTFTSTTQDFIVEDTVGTPNFLPPDTLGGKYSAAAWVAVSPSTFTVAPGQQQILSYYIQAPGDASPGGHYTGVLFKPDSTVQTDGSGAAVNTYIGTLFSIIVEGPIKEDAKVVKFGGNRFQEYGPITIKTQIKNNGDLHIKPRGSITISNMLGRRSQLHPLKETNVFPGATRDFENQVGKKIMFGRYKANLTASYGQNNNLPLVASATFWIIPWRILAVMLLVLVVAVLGYLYWRKRNGPTTTTSTTTTEAVEPTTEPQNPTPDTV